MKTKTGKLNLRQNALKALMIVFDALAVNCAYFLALLLRYYVTFEFNPDATKFLTIFMKMAPYYGVICVAVFYFFRLYNTMWKFGGLRDLNRIFMACVVTTLIQVAGTSVFFEEMPLTYYVLGFVIQLALIAFARFAYRLYLLERNTAEAQRRATTNVMVIGMGSVGQFICNQLGQDRSMKLACVVSSKEEWSNQYLNGVPVISGLDDLEKVMEQKKIGYVILADENLSEDASRRIKTLCDAKNVEVQDYIEFIQGSNDADAPIAVAGNTDGHRVIPFSPPDITDAEIDEVKRAMKSGWITTGPRTKELSLIHI